MGAEELAEIGVLLADQVGGYGDHGGGVTDRAFELEELQLEMGCVMLQTGNHALGETVGYERERGMRNKVPLLSLS